MPYKSEIPDFVTDYVMWAEPRAWGVMIHLQDRETGQWVWHAVGKWDVDLFIEHPELLLYRYAELIHKINEGEGYGPSKLD